MKLIYMQIFFYTSFFLYLLFVIRLLLSFFFPLFFLSCPAVAASLRDVKEYKTTKLGTHSFVNSSFSPQKEQQLSHPRAALAPTAHRKANITLFLMKKTYRRGQNSFIFFLLVMNFFYLFTCMWQWLDKVNKSGVHLTCERWISTYFSMH